MVRNLPRMNYYLGSVARFTTRCFTRPDSLRDPTRNLIRPDFNRKAAPYVSRAQKRPLFARFRSPCRLTSSIFREYHTETSIKHRFVLMLVIAKLFCNTYLYLLFCTFETIIIDKRYTCDIPYIKKSTGRRFVVISFQILFPLEKTSVPFFSSNPSKKRKNILRVINSSPSIFRCLIQIVVLFSPNWQ